MHTVVLWPARPSASQRFESTVATAQAELSLTLRYAVTTKLFIHDLPGDLFDAIPESEKSTDQVSWKERTACGIETVYFPDPDR